MPRRLLDLTRATVPVLDLASYARHGPGRRDRLSPAHIALIARTVRRTPEVMIKMLNQGGNTLGAVARHLKYLDRGGELEIERDDGEPLQGKGAAKALMDDWDLDLDQRRATASPKLAAGRKPPKLVHKMIFSMPAGTPPEKVLAAVKNFAREEFALKHRYAMVLHTDEPHPHVHMVVKAMGKDGRRLNIRHATLREWRPDFARHLRAQGVEANATERAIRGVAAPQKIDGIYRAAKRGASTHWRQRAKAVVRQIASGERKVEPGKTQLIETREKVIRGWNEIADDLVLQGQVDLAQAVRLFVKGLPPVRTEREWIRDRLLASARSARLAPSLSAAECLRQHSDEAAARLAAEQARARLAERARRKLPERQKEFTPDAPGMRERMRNRESNRTR